MEARFPDVDWYRDACDTHLNDQTGFDDRRATWNCRECGLENRIAADEIINPYEFLASFNPNRFGKLSCRRWRLLEALTSAATAVREGSLSAPVQTLS